MVLNIHKTKIVKQRVLQGEIFNYLADNTSVEFSLSILFYSNTMSLDDADKFITTSNLQTSEPYGSLTLQNDLFLNKNTYKTLLHWHNHPKTEFNDYDLTKPSGKHYDGDMGFKQNIMNLIEFYQLKIRQNGQEEPY